MKQTMINEIKDLIEKFKIAKRNYRKYIQLENSGSPLVNRNKDFEEDFFSACYALNKFEPMTIKLNILFQSLTNYFTKNGCNVKFTKKKVGTTKNYYNDFDDFYSNDDVYLIEATIFKNGKVVTLPVCVLSHIDYNRASFNNNHVKLLDVMLKDYEEDSELVKTFSGVEDAILKAYLLTYYQEQKMEEASLVERMIDTNENYELLNAWFKAEKKDIKNKQKSAIKALKSL